MLGKLNHIAIAVPNLNNAINTYQNILDVKIGEQIEQPLHGVKVAFIELPNAKIELLEPLGDNSPIIKFLQKNKNGGIHHVC